jgi:hypothetical protein
MVEFCTAGLIEKIEDSDMVNEGVNSEPVYLPPTQDIRAEQQLCFGDYGDAHFLCRHTL